MSPQKLFIALGLAAGTAVSGTAHAAAVVNWPAPYAGVASEGLATTGGINSGTNLEIGTTYAPNMYVSAGTTRSPVPSVTLTSTAPTGPDDNTNYYINGAAGLVYYFNISGPDSTILIPVKILGYTDLQGSPGGSDAQMRASVFVDGFHFDQFCSKNQGGDESGTCGLQYFSGLIDTYARPDYFGLIQLSAQIYARLGGSGSVYIDPFFEIDPVWSADHPGYSLAVSDGFGNEPPGTTSVPEPQSYALVMSGLALLGVANRRRQSRDSASSSPKVVSK